MLSKVISQAKIAFKLQKSDEGGANEFLIECGTLTEKLAWAAAIEAHTIYIESLLESHAQNQERSEEIMSLLNPLNFDSTSKGMSEV
ncbi:hypothetical protein EON65_38835 [archaeon]|nr:MAG: hypothetical protein EON65_38835 [archaeon]